MELNGGIRGSATMGAKKRIAMKNNGDGGGEASDLSKWDEWTQTGYTSTVVGMTLYSLIVLSFWIIQFLLFALTVEYCEYLCSYITSSLQSTSRTSTISRGNRHSTGSYHLVRVWYSTIFR